MSDIVYAAIAVAVWAAVVFWAFRFDGVSSRDPADVFAIAMLACAPAMLWPVVLLVAPLAGAIYVVARGIAYLAEIGK